VRDQRWQEINSLVSIPSSESTVDRVPVVFFSIDSTVYCKTETEGQSEEESSNDNSTVSSAQAEELKTNNPSNKRLMRLRENFLLSVLESSFFQHDVSIQQENALDRLENVSWTLQRS
jgi:hypothetical protein